MRRKGTGYHSCTLDNAGAVYHRSRFLNFVLRMTLISEHSSRARIFFRSNASIYFERKRHLQTGYKYIIHPFSLFRFYWEATMIIAFVVLLGLLPYNVARNLDQKADPSVTPSHGFLLVCDFLCLIDVALYCVTGYVSNVTMKEICLTPKWIFWKYFKFGGFIIDLLASTPYQTLRYGEILSHNSLVCLIMLSLLKVVRSRTLYTYFRQLLVNWQVNTILFKFIIYVAISIFILHWAACMFLIVPKCVYEIDDQRVTWLDKAGLRNNDTLVQYKYAVFMATATFLCVQYTRSGVGISAEAIISAIVVIVGYVMSIFIFVIILQMVLSSNTPATKYESIMSQLRQYMRHRHLPLNLQHRLVQHYTHKFRKTYFRESAIMPILSDRLQVEINVHCYTKLVESVSILQQLPDHIVAQIVANLKAEIYLPNDIIIKAGTFGDCMYFISSGTVVVSTANGHEVCHLQDGAYFGEVALIRKDNKRIANVVAIEFSEVYKLESRVFKTCLAEQPETYKKLEKISQDRYNRTNFLEELHKKHILERTMARKRDLD